MRNRIRQKSNEKEPTAWIKIPTIVKKSETKIKDVLIDNSQKWRESHIKAFQVNYGKNYEKIDLTITQKIGKEIVTLPMHPNLTEKQVDHVIKTANSLQNC